MTSGDLSLESLSDIFLFENFGTVVNLLRTSPFPPHFLSFREFSFLAPRSFRTDPLLPDFHNLSNFLVNVESVYSRIILFPLLFRSSTFLL